MGLYYWLERPRRAPLSLLDGVPVSTKDNIAVAGLPTRYVSRAAAPEAAASDSPGVARLREAGAI